MKKFLIGFLMGAFLVFLGLRFAWQSAPIPKDLRKYSQDPLEYAAPDEPVSAPETFLNDFLKPWTLTDEAKITDTFESIKEFTNEKGKHYTEEDRLKLLKRITPDTSFKLPANGITVRNTEIRIIPSHRPLYDGRKSPTFGPPFDNARGSFIPVGTPLKIYRITEDRAFALVKTPHSLALWMPFDDIGFVTDETVETYKRAEYKAVTMEGIRLSGHKGHIGTIVPVNAKGEIGLPEKDQDHGTEILWHGGRIEGLENYPVAFTSKKLMTLAKEMQGPYVWGGIRDCSSYLRDMFIPFGISMPRNSARQADSFKSIDLSEMSPENKKKTIISEGIPFKTMVYLPGHIMLYIGTENGEPLVLHKVWGIRTYDLLLNSDRAVIGKSAITSLNLGKDFWTARATQNILSDRITKMVFLTQPNPEKE